MPWLKWNCGDWLRDPGVRRCGLAARGLWMDMLCHMDADAERGYLTDNGKPAGLKDIAFRLGIPWRTVQPLLKEIEERGVFSRDERGAIYSRRMLRDQAAYAAASAAGAKGGGNPALKRAAGLAGEPVHANVEAHSTTTDPSVERESTSTFAVKLNENNDIPAQTFIPDLDKKEDKVQPPTGARAADAAPAPVVDLHPVRTAFWRAGLPAAQRLFPQYGEASCRRYLGRLLKHSGDRHQAVLTAMAEAEARAVLDPGAWLMKAVAPGAAGGAPAAEDPVTRRRREFLERRGLAPQPAEPDMAGPIIEGRVG